ncbi:hypothetical protein ACFVT8_23565 [Lysinibacillus sp. NPDC058147]|uniref:hypothetical protein n=1 Tax=unclassified Lysinibacillus TaxID=2636778 RepID=UPI0036DA002A
MEKQMGLEKAIDQLRVLFEKNIENELGADWKHAVTKYDDQIKISINDLNFCVEFGPTTMITFDCPTKGKQQVDIVYVDGQWLLNDYSDWTTVGDFEESNVKRVIHHYFFLAKG